MGVEGMAYEIQQAKIKKRPVRYFDQDFKEVAREEHLAQRMKSWRFRLWYMWYGFLFKIKMMLGRDVK